MGVGVTMMHERCAAEVRTTDRHISFRKNMESPWSVAIMKRLTTRGMEPQAHAVWRSESDMRGWSIRTCKLISCFSHSFRSSFRTKWIFRIQKIVCENSENYRIINSPNKVEVLWFISNRNYYSTQIQGNCLNCEIVSTQRDETIANLRAPRAINSIIFRLGSRPIYHL